MQAGPWGQDWRFPSWLLCCWETWVEAFRSDGQWVTAPDWFVEALISSLPLQVCYSPLSKEPSAAAFLFWADRSPCQGGRDKKDRKDSQSVGEDMEKLEHTFIPHQNVKWCNHCRNLAVPWKVQHRVTTWLSNSFPRYMPQWTENRDSEILVGQC